MTKDYAYDPDLTSSDLKAGTGRLTSLDAFRGLTLAGMILVNNPGSWDHVYPPLRHASWDGWTPTDLVFPSFVFIVGVAIPLAIGKRLARGDSTGSIMGKVFRRTLIIFAIGLLLNAFPFDEPFKEMIATWRIPGVLQRIAICYFFASLIYLKVGVKGQLFILATLLIGYWGAMKYIPVPGVGAGDLSKPNNLAAWIDRSLLPGHIYRKEYDPEGILSTLPAIGTALIGVLTGVWLSGRRLIGDKVAGIFAGGTLCFLVGWGWSATLPLNKALWSSSFTLYSAGLSLLLLGMCAFLIEVLDHRKWALPFLILGSNPIVAYAGSGMLANCLGGMIKVTTAGGKTMSAKPAIYDAMASVADPAFASLLYGLTYVLLWIVIMSIFYRFKLYIRV